MNELSKGKEFTNSFIWTFGVLMVLAISYSIASGKTNELIVLSLGFLVIASLSGIISLLIPSNKKVVYITTGMFVSIITVVLIGFIPK